MQEEWWGVAINPIIIVQVIGLRIFHPKTKIKKLNK